MTRWLALLIAALALASVFAEEDTTEVANNEEDQTPRDETKDKKHEEMMEKLQNIHLHQDLFLGDYIKGFRDLNEADRAKKLQELIKREIDTDKDGFASVNELQKHYHRVSKMYRTRESEEMLKNKDDDKDGKISWEEFLKHTYEGDLDEETKEVLAKEKKRFAHADLNGDSLLNNEEFHSFNQPIDDERMTNYSMNEHMEKHDSDKDGALSFEEFKASFTNDEDDSMTEELKKDFDENYDLDKDNKLTKEEIKAWFMPDHSSVNEQAERLLKKADDDKDGKLSSSELNEHISLFMDKPLNEKQDGNDEASEGEDGDNKTKHDEL